MTSSLLLHSAVLSQDLLGYATSAHCVLSQMGPNTANAVYMIPWYVSAISCSLRHTVIFITVYMHWHGCLLHCSRLKPKQYPGLFRTPRVGPAPSLLRPIFRLCPAFQLERKLPRLESTLYAGARELTCVNCAAAAVINQNSLFNLAQERVGSCCWRRRNCTSLCPPTVSPKSRRRPHRIHVLKELTRSLQVLFGIYGGID